MIHHRDVARRGGAGRFQHRARPLAWAGAVLAALLSGCQTAPSAGSHTPHDARPAADAGLFRWVDQDLAPYLSERLATHPRFKSEPVLVVALKGTDVRPDIDELTRSVRARLVDHLLRERAVSLVWQPATRPPQHHRHTPEAVCMDGRRAQHYIGLDIDALPDGQYRASVRALDWVSRAWVPGFGRSWTGSLTPDQQRALARTRTDEFLRGLRVLPFRESETDLLAAYLTRNLGCLIDERGGGGLRVFVQPAPQPSADSTRVLKLVGNYLRRESALRIADAPDEADLILTGSLTPIHGRLHQAWLSVRPASNPELLAAVDTDAYIELGASPEASRPADGFVETNADTPAGLISPIRLIASGDPACGGEPVSAAGHAPDEPPTSGRPCTTLEFDLYRDADLLLLGHRPDGRLVRLSRGACAQRTGIVRLRAGADHSVTIFGAREATGVESFYALAVADAAAARALRRHWRKLPEWCDGSSIASGRRLDVDLWLSELDLLTRRFSDRIDWQGLRVRRHGSGPHLARSR